MQSTLSIETEKYRIESIINASSRDAVEKYNELINFCKKVQAGKHVLCEIARIIPAKNGGKFCRKLAMELSNGKTAEYSVSSDGNVRFGGETGNFYRFNVTTENLVLLCNRGIEYTGIFNK